MVKENHTLTTAMQQTQRIISPQWNKKESSKRNVSKTNFKLLYLNILNGNLQLAEFGHKLLEMEIQKSMQRKKMRNLLTRINEKLYRTRNIIIPLHMAQF